MTSGIEISAESSRLKQIYGNVNMRLLPFMLVLYIISYLDRINISFAGAPMMKDLHFGEDVFGQGAGIFFLGYCVFGVPSNLILQRVGTRRWISILMVAWGLVSVSFAFVKTQEVFFAMRFFLGVAEAGFFPGMILYLTRWFPKKQHGIAVAKFMSAIPVAGILGGLIASQVLAMPIHLGLAPWKWLFVITGSPSILLGIIVWFYLPDSPHVAPWLTAEEKTLLLEQLEQDPKQAEAVPKNASGLQTTLASLVDPKIWLMCLLYFSVTISMYGFQLWLPQILKDACHYSDSECAFYSIFPAICQALGMILIAGNSDRTGERRFHLTGAAIGASLCLVGSAYSKEPLMIVASLGFSALGIWGTVGPFWAIATSFMSGAGSAAGIGLINSIGNLGGYAGPYVIGKIKSQHADFQSSLLFMASTLIGTAVIGLIAGSGKNRSNQTQPKV